MQTFQYCRGLGVRKRRWIKKKQNGTGRWKESGENVTNRASCGSLGKKKSGKGKEERVKGQTAESTDKCG